MKAAPPLPDDARTRGLWRVFLVLGIVSLSVTLTTFALFVLRSAGRLIPILIFAVLLVYLVVPVVNWLRRFIPKTFAVLITFVGMLAIIAGFAAVVLPPLVNQAQLFAAALPDATLRAQAAIADPNNTFFHNFPASLREELALAPQRFFGAITRYGVALGRQGFSAILSTFSLFLVFVIIPVLAVYLLFDYTELELGILGFFPRERRPRAMAIVRDLSGVMGAFVRGQVLDGVIVGSMIFVLLYFMRVPFAVVIATAAGVLNLIPYAGAIAGFIPSVLLALAYNGLENAAFVAIGFAAIQQIDGDLVVPRIMNASVKLPPVVIIVSIIGFGSLFGIFGALLAVPIAAMLRVLKLHFAPSPSPDDRDRDLAQAQSLMKFK